jgi:hypothetical protein
MIRSIRTLIALAVLALTMIPAGVTAADKAIDPCSLLTPAEIQAVVGKPVKAGTPKVQSNPLAGADCTYVIGDFGSFNVLHKPLQRGETPEVFKAQFAKMKMAPVDLPGVADAAFFTSPGFGMVQLHAFKGSKYILFTLLVPGLNEQSTRPMAAKLMKTVASRIK